MQTFRVALTADFFDADGRPKVRDYGLGRLEEMPAIEVSRLDRHLPEITADQIAHVQAVLVLTPRVTAESLARAENLLVISRFGVGYDAVDVAACTAADVLLTVARGAVDRSMAEATVGWMIGLAHHVLVKDRLVREGRWDDRTQYMGSELRDRTLGVIGYGGIGRALVSLLAGFGMQTPLVYDPYAAAHPETSPGVRFVDLPTLLADSDFVSLNCPLTEETRYLIGRRELEQMKPTAYLINTARGGVVDEGALFQALSSRRIAGAALDCFEGEPITSPHRFGALDNVLLAPHAIGWTLEMFRDIGRAASQSILESAHGRRPAGVVNPQVFDRPSFREKWDRLRVGE